MKNEDVLELIRQCDLKEGEVLIPGKAYLFNKRFSHNQPGEKEEIIVLTKNEIKVGGIYRMGSYDIHVVMEKRYMREQDASPSLCAPSRAKNSSTGSWKNAATGCCRTI